MSDASVHEHKNTVRFSMVLLVTMIGIGAMAVVLAIYWVLRPTPTQPFTFETVRIEDVLEGGLVVIPQVPGFDAPSLYVDDHIPATYPRCSSADREVEAVGNSWMVNASTGDRYTLNANIESMIQPGCATPRFHLTMPTQVQLEILNTASGANPSGESSAWYIQGQLTPRAAGGRASEYRSETFLIIASYRPPGER